MTARYFSSNGEKMKINPRFRSYLDSQASLNITRKFVLALFMESIQKNFDSGFRIRIALVGGSRHDPELSSLRELGFDYNLTTFGIDGSDEFLDLNVPSELKEHFDLVICSQVLEHVWNTGVAIETLCSMVKPTGKLWISVPTSNRKHASPDYFSAGYTPNFLALNSAKYELKVLFSKDFGSKREYAARHLLPIWLSERGHRFPLFFAFEGKTILRQLVLSVLHLHTLLYLQLSSSKLLFNSKYSSETVFLASKST